MSRAHEPRALALLRIVTGLLVFSHGVRKLIAGPASAIGGVIAAKHLPFPGVLAWLVTFGELAGLALALGFKTRGAALAVALTMGSIVLFVQLGALTNVGTGSSVAAEYTLLLAILSFAFVIVGPATWALDKGR
jgi:uncharacterized membrane protein YphA (DoxX/SURF4 family)